MIDRPCQARQYSDMMRCVPCDLTWDTNDPEPPPCRLPPPSPALISGIGRDADCKNALVLFCSRRPTDDEMREILKAAKLPPL